MVEEEVIKDDSDNNECYGDEYYPISGTRADINTYQLQFIKNCVTAEISKHEYADPFKNSEELKQYLSILVSFIFI